MLKLRNSVKLFFKGMGMGGADVVPGVSGGTIAFITGIYEELLNSIKSVDLDAVKLLFSLKLAEFWKKINGAFLLPLLLGIATSILSLAKLLSFLLKAYPIHLWSFFFGLIIISTFIVLRVIRKWSLSTVIALIIGVAVAYAITAMAPATTPDHPIFIFIAGAIAICAMILPGISGSFILLMLGKYQQIFTALSNFDIKTIGIFALGCLVGLLSFVRLVSWLLKKYHDVTVALLAGFMVGSLNKIWPWKIPLAFRMNSHGEQVAYYTRNALPAEFTRELGQEAYVLEAVLFMALGIVLVVGLEKIANYRKSS